MSALIGVKVLLAEDNELNAELAITLLEEAGMHVTRAVDGQNAVACFANNPADTYDVILMDVLMPKMNGHQAVKGNSCNEQGAPRRCENSNHRTICKCFQGRCTGILGFWN
ncbi:MAG: response regulator [Clostridium fessum]